MEYKISLNSQFIKKEMNKLSNNIPYDNILDIQIYKNGKFKEFRVSTFVDHKKKIIHIKPDEFTNEYNDYDKEELSEKIIDVIKQDFKDFDYSYSVELE
jgi:hypothetical protein